MNCKHCQEKIVESLAAGMSALPSDVVSHQNSCAPCDEFFAVQKNLFQSMDTGLRALVNRPVPPSLLPGLLPRLERNRPVTSRLPLWIPAAAALLLAVLITTPYHRRPPTGSQLTSHSQEQSPVPRHSEPEIKALNVAPVHVSRQTSRVHAHRALQPGNSTAHPLVLFDHQELQALAHLASTVQQHPEWGKGLLHPVALPPIDLEPIPAIQISDLRVAPLTEERW